MYVAKFSFTRAAFTYNICTPFKTNNRITNPESAALHYIYRMYMYII